MAPNVLRQRAHARHGDRGARCRQDRGLGAGRGRGQHGEDQELADAGAEHVGRQRGEEVVAVEFFEPGLGEGHRGDGDDHIEADQQDGREDGGARRRAVRVLGFFVHRGAGIPAPIDEYRDQHGLGKIARAVDGERIEPVERDAGAVGVARIDLLQRHRGEDEEDDDLGGEQHFLRMRGELDAEITDRGHGHDPGDADRGHRKYRRLIDAEQMARIGAGNLGEARHDQNIGGENDPAAHPAAIRADGARRPGERGAAIGVGVVEMIIGDRDEQHRHES